MRSYRTILLRVKKGLVNLSDRELSINKRILILSLIFSRNSAICHSNRFLDYVYKINVAIIITNNANVP